MGFSISHARGQPRAGFERRRRAEVAAAAASPEATPAHWPLPALLAFSVCTP